MNLFYKKIGEGYPLLILHGLYGSSDNWYSVGKMLSEFFEVYLIDSRNHGKSFHHSDHNYKNLSADLYHFMVYHHLEKAILMGHSMGGKTLMQFAIDYPQMINKLIVIDIAPKSYLDSKHVLFHTNIIKTLKSIDFEAAQSRKNIEEQIIKDIPDRILRNFLLKNIKHENAKFCLSLNIDALHDNIENLINKIEFQTPVTEFPTLFIRAEKSDYILDEDIAYIMAFFPNAIIKTISDTTHWLHAEKPDELIRLVRNFVFNSII